MVRNIALAAGFVGSALACASIFPDRFMAPKWVALYALAGLLGAMNALDAVRARRLPPGVVAIDMAMSGSDRALVILLAAFFGLGLAMNASAGVALPGLLGAGCWLSLYWAFCRALETGARETLASASTQRLALGTCALVSAYGLAQAVGWQLIPGLITLGTEDAPDYASAFGHPNLAAEFVAMGLLYFAWAWKQRRAKETAGWTHWLEWAMAGLCAAYLVRIGCRSVLGGLVLAITLLWRPAQKRRTWIALGCGVALLSVLFFTHNKTLGNLWWRLQLWRDTLLLIRDHPLGIGADNFAFQYVPYQAKHTIYSDINSVIRSPHNELLRWMAEYGVPTTVLFLAIAARRVCKFTAKGEELATLVTSALVLFVVDAFFQSPLQNPAVFFASALVAAVVMNGSAARAAPKTWHALAAGALALGLAAVSLYGGSRMALSSYYAGTRWWDREAMARACELYPHEWMTCLSWAYLEGEHGDREKAKGILAAILRRNPHNFLAAAALRKFDR